MKHRISTVTTRTGDSGTTRLADGTKVAKTDSRIIALGTVDELNSFVGLLVTELEDASTPKSLCVCIQQELFDLGANLATAGATPLPALDHLDTAVAEMNAKLPPLKEFVLPGGSRAAALAHVCRTVCRRAERLLWELGACTDGARYLNRLSDVFFVMARTLNAGHHEPQWHGSQRPGGKAENAGKAEVAGKTEGGNSNVKATDV
ncbi:MAG: cob(I)yrinic acid a,c-diamide adenosyltransferase [Gammaproteobacteria bacterium]|nr:MAG: cob(I)yrinic acid a,c-diamide adenosyltransferase [Gammaproteobacteria bacterium]